MNAIASDRFDYRSLRNMEPEDIGIVTLFLSATKELVQVLMKRVSVPTAEFSHPATPTRPTVKPDPNYSGESTSSKESWDSADSKPEHYIQIYVYRLVDASLEALKLGRVPWIDKALSIFRTRYDFPIPPTNFSTTHKMMFKLGIELVRAEDDGGISLAINIPNLKPVVLSVEVSSHSLSSH